MSDDLLTVDDPIVVDSTIDVPDEVEFPDFEQAVADRLHEIHGTTPDDEPDVVEPVDSPVPSADDGGGIEPPSEPETYQLAGRDITAQQAEELLQVYDWVTTMDAQTAEAVAAAGAGNYDYFRQTQPTQASVAPPEVAPTPVAPVVFEFDDMVEPQVAEAIHAIHAQNAQLQAQLQGMLDQQSQQAAVVGQQHALNAVSQVQDKYGLTDADMSTIGQRTLASGLVPTFRSQGMSEDQLYTTAFETVLFSDPTYRQRVVDAEVASKLAESSQETAAIQSQNQAKKRRSASIASSGGSVNRSAPSPRDMSQQDKLAAMAQEIAQDMGV